MASCATFAAVFADVRGRLAADPSILEAPGGVTFARMAVCRIPNGGSGGRGAVPEHAACDSCGGGGGCW